MSETLVFDPPEQKAPADGVGMNRRVQMACVWTGPIMIIGWVAAFVVLARFIPPPSPEKSPADVVDMYREHTGAIQLGLVITLFASALLVPFAAVISAQMRRIEGPRSVMAWTQLVSAGLLSLEFIIPLMIWQTAAYRVDSNSAEIIRMLNDMGWLMFVGVISSAVVEFGSIGVAILADERDSDVFPRWAGYFNLWVAVLIIPAGVVPFFKDGPFAWNGAFAFFLPLVVFAAWIVVMTVLLRRAIDTEAQQQTA
ncbi:hypothetical protein DSM112329_00474 [Paraconexibacter sp. AEG42_29]|uniref:DUF4386 domain-containing protein n=1 Tax=Paraconexibacter sp. AEG42_29 TaxID=2997339 RepID=A0AAU7AQ08_9ACTN